MVMAFSSGGAPCARRGTVPRCAAPFVCKYKTKYTQGLAARGGISDTRGAVRVHASDASGDQLDDLLGEMLDDIPEIADDLESFQERLGAVFKDGIAVSFGKENDRKASEAWQFGIVLVDRSHWGRVRFSGADHLRFLHSQSTQDIAALQPGQGAPTVFVTSTGRTVDTGAVLVQGKGAIAVVSPGMAAPLQEQLQARVFPMDDVKMMDLSPHTRMFTVLGPESHTLVEEWGGEALLGLPENHHALLGFNDTPLIALRSSGLGRAVQGWTFIVDESVAADFWRKTALKGAIPMGEQEWERARVLNGVPKPGSELTEDFNPLEAGLYHAVSFDKGCYIGQETLAKVHNRNGIKQELWGLRVREGEECAAGDVVESRDGRKLGCITSATTDEGQTFALAYLRCRAEGQHVELEGAQVTVAGVPAKVVALKFATRRPADLPAAEEADADEEAEQQAADAKLKAMQERLAQWQAQNKR